MGSASFLCLVGGDGFYSSCIILNVVILSWLFMVEVFANVCGSDGYFGCCFGGLLMTSVC